MKWAKSTLSTRYFDRRSAAPEYNGYDYFFQAYEYVRVHFGERGAEVLETYSNRRIWKMIWSTELANEVG